MANWVFCDSQTEPLPPGDDEAAVIPAGFKAALKARLVAQGPMKMPDAITWGINWCGSQGCLVRAEKVRNRIQNCMEDWHPAVIP